MTEMNFHFTIKELEKYRRHPQPALGAGKWYMVHDGRISSRIVPYEYSCYHNGPFVPNIKAKKGWILIKAKKVEPNYVLAGEQTSLPCGFAWYLTLPTDIAPLFEEHILKADGKVQCEDNTILLFSHGQNARHSLPNILKSMAIEEKEKRDRSATLIVETISALKKRYRIDQMWDEMREYKIRYKDITNPFSHLFSKTKLVRTLKTEHNANESNTSIRLPEWWCVEDGAEIFLTEEGRKKREWWISASKTEKKFREAESFIIEVMRIYTPKIEKLQTKSYEGDAYMVSIRNGI